MRFFSLAILACLLAAPAPAAENFMAYPQAKKMAKAADIPLVVFKGWYAEDIDGAIVTQVNADDHLFREYPWSCAIVSVNGQWLATVTAQDRTHEAIKAALPKRKLVGCETGKCTYAWTFNGKALGACQGPGCGGPSYCNTGGSCSDCLSCQTARRNSTSSTSANCSTGR